MITNNKIIQSGLIQHIDPRNPRSYQGGTYVKDLSTNATTGTVGGAPSVEFNSLNHTGATSFISMNFPQTSLTNITVTFWIKFTTTNTIQYPLIIGSGSAFNSLMFDFNDNDGGGLYRRIWVYWNSSGSPLSALTPTTGAGTTSDFLNNDWWCYTFRRNVSVSPFTDHFINGQKVTTLVQRQASQTASAFVPSSSPTARLGADQIAHGDQFRGKIGAYHTYNRALADSEILYNYEVERPYYPVYDADTKAYLAQLTGTYSEKFCRDVDTLVRRLKASGIWTLLDRFWIFATEQQQHARVSLKNPTSTQCTESGTPTWTMNRGYSRTGGSRHVNTNYTPLTDAVQYQQNSASYGCYVTQINDTAFTQCLGGYSAAGARDNNLGVYGGSSPSFSAVVNGNGGAADHTNRLHKAGMFSARRTASTVVQLYNNGGLVLTNGSVSSVLVDVPMFVLARNGAGTAQSHSLNQIAMAFYGNGAIDHVVLQRIFQQFAKDRGFAV